jgi:hypothetical protein
VFALDLLDSVLILGVACLVTVIAFVDQPRVKALIFSFPIPFSLANLSLGTPIGAAHAVGLLNLLLFVNLARWLHVGARVPIVPTIVLSAGAYIGIAAALNPVIPDTAPAFWVAYSVVVATGVTLLFALPDRSEPRHRSELPVPVKFLAVGAVVTLVVILKGMLGGFMTTFPLAGVTTVYETRKSLWTLSRQAPLLILAVSTMMLVMRLSQTLAGMGVALSLLPGLAAWAAVMTPVTILRWRADDRRAKRVAARSGARETRPDRSTASRPESASPADRARCARRR